MVKRDAGVSSPEGARVPWQTPDFGRSVNPISTGEGGDCACQIILATPPEFSDFLGPWHELYFLQWKVWSFSKESHKFNLIISSCLDQTRQLSTFGSLSHRNICIFFLMRKSHLQNLISVISFSEKSELLLTTYFSGFTSFQNFQNFWINQNDSCFFVDCDEKKVWSNRKVSTFGIEGITRIK